MGIIPKNNYTTKVDSTDPNYPQGKAQNVTAPGDGTGTPFEAAWVNDLWGFFQKLLDDAAIVPSGNPDSIAASDYFNAVGRVFGRYVEYVDSGPANSIAISASIGTDPVAYTDGMRVNFFLAATLTGAATIAIGALGQKDFTLRGGVAFAGKELYTDEPVEAIFNSGANRFELASQISEVGIVETWPLAAPPAWGLLCDGAAVSRTTYANLFLLIGTTYGVGDGATTFNLPDYKGEFLRGTDNGAGRDPDAAGRTDRGDGTTGDVVGSKQDDALQGHWHQDYYWDVDGAGGGVADRKTSRNGTSEANAATAKNIREAITDGVNGVPRTAAETRGRNVNVNYVIRHR